MAVDRQGIGLAIMRVGFGVFFIAEGLSKIGWMTDVTILLSRLRGWLEAAGSTPASRWYLERIAIPGVDVFARLVPVGEVLAGAALVVGFYTPLAAFAAFFMALNFQVASGAVFHLGFLTSGYGLPVLGPMFALALGGRRLPLSLR